MKTSELTGAALDWAVAKAAGYTTSDLDLLYDIKSYDKFNPSIDWSQGGPIIERERIALDYRLGYCVASVGSWDTYSEGLTPLIAAMRCYVASKIGDTVDIPKELL